jgi:type I restriction enzyme S subunit
MSTLFSPNIDASDKEYMLIRDEPRFKSDKQFLEQLWKKYEPYADRNFRIEIARQFHQRFWEMYLTCTLLELKYKFIKKKRGKGPDICLKLESSRIWMEAVAPIAGIGPDAVPQLKLKFNQVTVEWVPSEQIILRFTSAIDNKHNCYLSYCDKKVVNQNESYVIAINGSKVLFPRTDDMDLPFIIQAVFGLGDPTITINTNTWQIVKDGFSFRPFIVKRSGESVSTLIFIDEKHHSISGILFSSADICNRPHKAGQEFIFAHNPKAINPLPKGWLTIGNEYWFEEEKLFRKHWK